MLVLRGLKQEGGKANTWDCLELVTTVGNWGSVLLGSFMQGHASWNCPPEA